MRGRVVSTAAWLLLACAGGAHAQSIPEIVFYDFKNGILDMVHVWISPFQGSGKDYLTAGMVVAGAGLVSLADDPIGEWIHDNPNSAVLDGLKPWREGHALRFVDLGGGKHLTTINIAMYLTGLVAGSSDIRDAAIGCAASEKSNGIPRHWVYKSVSRERPRYREIEDDTTSERRGDPFAIGIPGEDTWYDNSFFAGHGANVMSCVSFWNHRFDLGIAEPLLWATAVGVNLGRMADERHWASDVVIGMSVGFAIGKYVAERQLARAEERSAGGGGEDDREDLRDRLLGGLYLSQIDGATFVGWKTRF
jgi:hypothetical protein